MVIRSTFYDTAPGEGVKETAWAESAQSRGPLYGVAGAGDLRLTAHPTTPYAVNLSPGKFWGSGVWDQSTETMIVQCPTPARDAIRWDLIAARRDWQPTGGGPTSFVAIPGATSKALPNERENRPGVVDDQPLYLVKWRGGRTQPEEIVDLRCWAANGGLEIVDKVALEYLGAPGATVYLGTDTWRFRPTGNGVWDWTDRAGETTKVPLALTYLYTPDPPRADRLTQEAPSAYREGRRVHLSGVASNSATVEFTGGIEYSLALIPAGLRPAKVEYFTIEAAFTICRVWVRPDGHVYFMFPVRVGPLTPRNWRFSLSGISYASA